jgi:hypothetical protein
MRKLILAAVVAAGCHAESICGKTYTTDAGLLVRVACIDVERFKALGVTTPPGLQSQTQVLIDVPDGVAVDVSLGGQQRLERVRLQQDGVRRALVSFEGIDHETLPEIVVLVAK